MKINLHVYFILLSSLQYFISLERLVTWSRAFCLLILCPDHNLQKKKKKKSKISEPPQHSCNIKLLSCINFEPFLNTQPSTVYKEEFAL